MNYYDGYDYPLPVEKPPEMNSQLLYQNLSGYNILLGEGSIFIGEPYRGFTGKQKLAKLDEIVFSTSFIDRIGYSDVESCNISSIKTSISHLMFKRILTMDTEELLLEYGNIT